MAKYVYPAVFTPEAGGFSVHFPDVENCFTEGDDLAEALEMAEDALCMMLYDAEEQGRAISAPSPLAALQSQLEPGEFVSLVACDTITYRRLHDNRAVKKTLSIPSWLNDMAERAGINFSGTLQEALKQQLHIG